MEVLADSERTQMGKAVNLRAAPESARENLLLGRGATANERQ